MQNTENPTRTLAIDAAKNTARAIRLATPRGPVETSIVAGLAPIAALTISPLAVAVAPVAIAVGIFALLIGSTPMTAQKSASIDRFTNHELTTMKGIAS